MDTVLCRAVILVGMDVYPVCIWEWVWYGHSIVSGGDSRWHGCLSCVYMGVGMVWTQYCVGR